MIIFLLFGGIFVVIGVIMTVRQLRLRRVCTVETQGVVLAMKERVRQDTETDANGNHTNITRTSYLPVFQYFADGRTIKRESAVSGNAIFKVGSRVTVFYNPEQVEEYYVAEEKAATYAGLYFAIIGTLFMLVPLFFRIIR